MNRKRAAAPSEEAGGVSPTISPLSPPCYVFAEPSLRIAQFVFYGYVITRLAHFVAYVTAQTHDLRAMMWTAGSLILIYMNVASLIAALD